MTYKPVTILHGCGAVWHNNRWAHCARCHRTFTSDTAADRHRTTTQAGTVCRDPATLGMVQREDHAWRLNGESFWETR